MPTDPRTAIDRAFREHAGVVTARLTRLLGDFDLAEDLVQDAIVAALEHWSREGVPDTPAAWLLTVARHKGIDRLRREATYRQKLALLEEAPPPMTTQLDDRLDECPGPTHQVVEKVTFLDARGDKLVEAFALKTREASSEAPEEPAQRHPSRWAAALRGQTLR